MGKRTLYAHHLCAKTRLLPELNPAKHTALQSQASISNEARVHTHSNMPASRSLEPANLSPADIVVLDENIDVEMDEDTADVKGSQLAKELRGRGFSGIVCILSGSSNEALRELATLPWVDFVFDKSTDAKSIGEALRAGYEANFGHSRLFQPPLRCQDKADV